MGIIAQHTVDGGAGALRCVPTGQGEGRRPGQRHIARRHIPIERPADIQVIACGCGGRVRVIADHDVGSARGDAVARARTQSHVEVGAVHKLKRALADGGVVVGVVHACIQRAFADGGVPVSANAIEERRRADGDVIAARGVRAQAVCAHRRVVFAGRRGIQRRMTDSRVVRARIIRRRGAAAQGLIADGGVVGGGCSAAVSVVHGVITHGCALALGDIGRKRTVTDGGIAAACVIEVHRIKADRRIQLTGRVCIHGRYADRRVFLAGCVQPEG